VLFGLLGTVAACSGGADQASSTDAAYDDDGAGAPIPADGLAGEAPAADRGQDGGEATDHDTAGPPGGGPSLVAATLGRRVIRTATLELEDADPGAVADRITRVTEQAGGFVATADLRRD